MYKLNIWSFQNFFSKNYHAEENGLKKEVNPFKTNQVLQVWNKLYMKSVFSISKYPIPIIPSKISVKVPDIEALEPMPNSNKHLKTRVVTAPKQYLDRNISSKAPKNANMKSNTINSRVNIISAEKSSADQQQRSKPGLESKNVPFKSIIIEKHVVFPDKM